MRFWDSSALVPLLLAESRSPLMNEMLLDDREIVAAAITPIEISSVLWRRRHAGILKLDAHTVADRRFASLTTRWWQVAQSERVIESALHLVTKHALRSLDALQLASAVAFASSPASLPFVTLDQDLAAAARAEGFPILP